MGSLVATCRETTAVVEMIVWCSLSTLRGVSKNNVLVSSTKTSACPSSRGGGTMRLGSAGRIVVSGGRCCGDRGGSGLEMM
jgi:hypothetical protein